MTTPADAVETDRPLGLAPVASVLAALGLAVAGLAAAARLTTTLDRPSLLVTALHVATGVAFLSVGVVASVRRPHNRVGLLMIVVGLTWFIIDLQFTPSSVAYTIGNLLGIVSYAVLAHLVLAFPSGRLTGRLDRALVAVVYVWMVLGNLLTETLYASPLGARASPHTLFVLHSDAYQHQVANATQLAANVLLGVLTFAVLLMHWRSASHLGRRALAPVLWSSAPILGIVVALDVVGLVTTPDWLSVWLPALTPIALMTLPMTFVVGMIRSRLARLAVGTLVVELRQAPTPHRLRDALARAAGDPTLMVAYRSHGHGEWIDADGSPISLPAPDSARSHTILEREGETVAALIHDRTLDDDPALIASVAAAASLALENERLEAEVRAQLMEVRASRARIVEAADTERRRLQRDLHDGAQQRLVALALHLGRLRDRLEGDVEPDSQAGLIEACEQLRLAIANLRELSSGIHPAILVEAGLGPALQSLADGAGVPVRIAEVPERRLPDPIEAAAYFVVSEALANVGKHANAHAVTVSARCQNDRLMVIVEDDGAGGADSRRGTGLSGLSDRVAALNGRLRIASPPGGGTRVIAELPCA